MGFWGDRGCQQSEERLKQASAKSGQAGSGHLLYWRLGQNREQLEKAVMGSAICSNFLVHCVHCAQYPVSWTRSCMKRLTDDCDS